MYYMEELTLTQEYFICAINEDGSISALNGWGIAVCLIVSEVMELTALGCVVCDEKHRLLGVKKPEEESLPYLQQMYNTLMHYKEPTDMAIVARSYSSRLGWGENYPKMQNNLLSPIGGPLAERGFVSVQPRKGLFHNKTDYIPKPEAVMRVTKKIRAAFLGNGEITGDVLCLLALLEKSNMLRKHFNKMETEALKRRLLELRESEAFASIRDILAYVDYVDRIVSTLDWGG